MPIPVDFLHFDGAKSQKKYTLLQDKDTMNSSIGTPLRPRSSHLTANQTTCRGLLDLTDLSADTPNTFDEKLDPTKFVYKPFLGDLQRMPCEDAPEPEPAMLSDG